MTAEVGPSISRFKLLFLVAAPLAVLAVAQIAAWSMLERAAPAERLGQRERALTGAFRALFEEATGFADAALAGSPERVWRTARSHKTGIGPRLEGVGVLDADLRFETWRGAPVDPPLSFADPLRPRFALRAGGASTRLLVRAGPDAVGRTALAVFIVDSILDDDRFDELLPSALQNDAYLEVSFHDAAAFRGAAEMGQGERRIELLSPQGDRLAVARLGLPPADRRAAQLRGLAYSTAVVLALALLSLWIPWGAICRRSSGFGALVAVAVAGRAALLQARVPSRMLPAELGTPTLYGSSAAFDLLASPADFALTGLTLMIFGLAARILGTELLSLRSRGGLAFVAGAAVGLTAAAAWLALSLASDCRVELLASPAPFDFGPRLVLWGGLLLALIGAAEVWALLAAGLTRRPADARPAAVAVGLVLLVAGASWLLQRETRRIAVLHLRSDYAPLVLDQASRRKLALSGAIEDVLCAAAETDPLHRPPVEYEAYRQWVGGALFHARYKSSLDFYLPDGAFSSHFGFGLPPLDDRFDPASGLSREPKSESIPGVPGEPKLLHAEAALVGPQGEALGFVVAHVLDEPENLPFLPWAQPYLAALGPGAAGTDGALGPPQYVLYDASGGVLLTTLLRPPAHDPILRQTAARAATLRVLAGDEPHLALPVEEPGGRLHLLLLPERTLAERLASAVRPALLALLLLCVARFPVGLLRRHGASGLADLIRGSLRRKLLAAVLVASVVPLIGLALFLRGYVERRADAELIASATRTVITAQHVIEDYAAPSPDAAPPELNDSILHWLRRVAGQEIQLYADGRLLATSTRELFDSGLLPPRLDGEVRSRLVEGGLPYLVTSMALGPSAIPVAYAPIHPRGSVDPPLVVAVPLVLEGRQIEAAAARVSEMILLATVALAGLLGLVAALLANTVAAPVRGLVEATRRIAAGDYATRLEPATRDEVADLVSGFNTMAQALSLQRHDLERRRDYIETVLRHATAGVISLDPAGRIVTLNPAGAALLAGCGARLQVGAALREALASSGELEALDRALFAPPPASGEPIEVDLARSPGIRRWRAVRVELSDRGEQLGTLILLDDVTDLMRSNQLAAWAEMARSIAHEIKNPLTPIQLSAEHLRRLLADRGWPNSAQADECVETIVKQVRALRDIAREFSTYAKIPVLAPEPTDPGAFLRETLAPYRASSPPGVRIEERYAAAPEVPIDRRVLGRAVINLVENALQAMPGGGTLGVGVDFDRAGRSVVLSVEDSGPGLAPEVRRRLFEPYFSTKSSGTGLGLAIARRAVEAHGGTIEVDTAAGRGTTFQIRIPAP